MDTPDTGSTDSASVEPRSAKLSAGKCRLRAVMVLAPCLVLLALAVWMTPAERGYGTHRQLGFGKCGMLVTTGLPCPTCGMTTAFAYTVRGRLFGAFMAQPTGLVLALGTIATALVAAWSFVTGRAPRINVPLLSPYRLFTILLVLLVGGWAFKIAVGLANGTLPDRG